MYKRAALADVIANFNDAYFLIKVTDDDTIGDLIKAAGESALVIACRPDPAREEKPKAEAQEKPKEKKPAAKKTVKPAAGKQLVNKYDHARIVALYTANPPRSIEWIAEDLGCSEKTVINHLIKEGIYKPVKKDGGE